MKMNRQKPFGKITPAYHAGDMDRPAHYEQDGHMFDAHDRIIIPGQALVEDAPVAVAAARVSATDLPPMPAQALIDAAETMPYAEFVTEAKRILGKTCPAGKDAIIVALTDAVAGHAKRAAKRTAKAEPLNPPSGGLTWDSVANGTPAQTDDAADDLDVPLPLPDAPPVEEPKPAKAKKSSDVNLAHWAQGKADYLFSDVQKAIRKSYNKQVTERGDALDFLIKEKLIPAALARQDI